MAAIWLSCPMCQVLFQADDTPPRPRACPACCRVAPAPGDDPMKAASDPGDELEWWYIREKQKIGPVSLVELRKQFADGLLKPADMVLKRGTSKWVPLSGVEALEIPPAPLLSVMPFIGDGGATGGGGQESNDTPNQDPQQTRAERIQPEMPTGLYQEPAAAAPGLPSVAGYEILSVLGRGGMGVVYKARHLSLKRVVALKMILRAEHATPEELARFRAEAEAVAQLQHPNIVQIHEVGQQEDRPYFSLEYVDGGSLARRIAGTPQPPQDAARTVEELASAMHYAHLHGIIHRDLKPANVLLQDAEAGLPAEKQGSTFRGSAPPTAPGTLQAAIPKITDFGLAKQLDREHGQTRSGAVLGTPSYMSPEQAAADTKALGPATDIYALGAILYELLTGRPPFRGETPLDTLVQVVSDDPVPPSRLVRMLPADLETICLKCLEKKPGKRYASAEALAEDLRHFRAREPIQARPVGMGEWLLKWGQRRPAAAGLILVSGLGTLVLIVGLSIGMAVIAAKQRQTTAALGRETKANQELDAAVRQITEEQEHTKAALGEKARALDAKAVALEQAERTAYYQRISLADHAWSAGKVAEAEDHLNACPVKLREWEWHYLKRLCNESLMTRCLENDVGGAAFSPDGKRLALKGHSSLVLWDVASGAVSLEIEGLTLGANSNVAISHDGRWIASAGESPRELAVWNAVTGRRERTFPHDDSRILRLAFHPDGNRLATNGARNDVKIWNVATGQELQTLRGHNRSVGNVVFSPDGAKLASIAEGRNEWEIKIWDLASGQVLRTFERVFGRALAFSPDGLRLAAADRAVVMIWDLASGEAVLALRGHAGAVEDIAFAPDGRSIVTGGVDQTVRVWDTTAGEEIRRFRGHRTRVKSVAFHPGGQLIASVSDECMNLWDATSGQEARELRGHRYVHAMAVNPWASQIISAGTKWADPDVAEARLWDTERGRPLRDFPAFEVAFSPDGRRLALAEIDHIRVLETETNREVFQIPVKNNNVRYAVRLKFSADGRHLAVSPGFLTPQAKVELYDVQTGTRQTIPGLTTAFHPDGRRLAVGDEHVVKLWDWEKNREIRRFTGYRALISCVAFSPDGRLLATATGPSVNDPCELKILDPVTGETLYVYRTGNRAISALAFSPNGRRLAVDIDRTGSGGRAGEVKLWDVTTWQEVLTLGGSTELALGHGHLAFSGDGHQLAGIGSDQAVRLWDATPGAEVHALPLTAQVYQIGYSGDGRRLIAASRWRETEVAPSAVHVWDVAGERWQTSVKEHPKSPGQLSLGVATLGYCAAISHDGRRIASAELTRAKADPGIITLWNADTGAELLQFRGHTQNVAGLAFDPSSTRLASVGGWYNNAPGELAISDVATGKALVTRKAHSAGLFCVVYSPDGKRLATMAKDKTVKVWNAATLQEQQTLRLPVESLRLAFSPDGSRIATAGLVDRQTRIWDIASGREVLAFKGHTGFVYNVCYRPDGQRIATASGDGTVRIWNASTGEEMRVLRNHRSNVMSVAYSPDGRSLASGGVDGTMRIWQIDETLPETETRARRTAANMVTAWRYRELESCEQNKRWFAAAFHLSELIRAEPKNASLYIRRASAYTQLGQADKAAADRAKAAELKE